jgi:hypothetical protein
MNIVTATNGRPEIASVWCAAVTATLTTPHEAIVLWHGREPSCACCTQHVPGITPIIGLALDRYAPGPVRMFLEEDMLPVRPWSVDDYPGRLLAAQGNVHGQPWPALLIKRNHGEPATAIVPQRFVREGGCPDWLPAELCEPALRANAKVLGQHFLHLDKMYRPEVPEAVAKNELLELLRSRFANHEPASRGLGDMVASGLSAVGITPERVSAALGVKDCGCKQRQQKLNELGRRLGIG